MAMPAPWSDEDILYLLETVIEALRNNQTGGSIMGLIQERTGRSRTFVKTKLAETGEPYVPRAWPSCQMSWPDRVSQRARRTRSSSQGSARCDLKEHLTGWRRCHHHTCPDMTTTRERAIPSCTPGRGHIAPVDSC